MKEKTVRYEKVKFGKDREILKRGSVSSIINVFFNGRRVR